MRAFLSAFRGLSGLFRHGFGAGGVPLPSSWRTLAGIFLRTCVVG
jgi:hypothetical protein